MWSASAGIDSTAASGTFTFAPGQTSQTITVPVNGDRTPEPTKTFFVNVSTPHSYAAISKGVVVGNSLDDEPHISIGDAWQDPYGSSITFTVSLAVPYDQVVTVDFTTVDDTALAVLELVRQRRIRATQVGTDTTFARIVRMVEDAEVLEYLQAAKQSQAAHGSPQ